jgi:nucleoside-diphosphate-sugar epimerase
MKVLITGTEGYIGARMAPILAAAGHTVVGLDTGFYRDGCLYMDPLGQPISPRTTYKTCGGSNPRTSKASTP